MLFVLCVLFKQNIDVNELIFYLRVSRFLFEATKRSRQVPWVCFGSRFLIFILPFRNERVDDRGWGGAVG